MDNKTQNNTSSWGIHINHKKDMSHPHVPQWVKAGDQLAWENSGVIIWSEAAHRVMCLLPHQALDVFDDLRESPDWRDAPFCLEWESYSIPFSEEDRVEWRTTKNRRSLSLRKSSVYGGIALTPEQTQELYLFLEQNQDEIREFADAKTKEARKVLGRVYGIILGWGRERIKRQEGNLDK